MKKKLVSALIVCLMMTNTSMVRAESNIELAGNVNLVSSGTMWEDLDTAPRVKIEIKDAYKKKGKQEKIVLEFNECGWVGGVCNIQIRDCENIESNKCAIGYSGDNDGEISIDIPNDIKEGDKISFTIPLTVRVTGEHPCVKIKSVQSDSLINETTVSIGVTGNNYLKYSVEDVPAIESKGVIGNISFEELVPGNWNREFEWFTITLDNATFDFNQLEYKEKKVHDSDTDYTIDSGKYIEYTKGFEGSEELYIKKYNSNSKKLTLKIQPSDYTDDNRGKVIIKNLPIIVDNSAKPGEIITAEISGDKLSNGAQNIKVAYIKEVVGEKVEEVEEIEKVQEEIKRGVFFTIGEKNYTVDGEKFDMEAETYISANGNIMVPVRYLAKALGIFENEIGFSDRSVYFLYGDKKIQLMSDSDIAYINQVAIPMASVIENKEGRMYVPLGEIARILGIKRKWYADTKTASFNEMD